MTLSKGSIMFIHRIHQVALLALLAALFAWPATPAAAAEIRDDAGFFSQKAIDRANSRLAEVKREYGKEVRIETFKTVPGGRGDEVAKMSRAERERFFEKWARERATSEHAKGIFILICKQPGHVQVEDDRQTRNEGFGSAERTELRDKLVAGFRDKDYAKGLLDGVDYLNREMQKIKPHNGKTAPATGTHRGESRRVEQDHRDAGRPVQRSSGMGWLKWVLVAIAILIGIRLV